MENIANNNTWKKYDLHEFPWENIANNNRCMIYYTAFENIANDNRCLNTIYYMTFHGKYSQQQ